MVNDKYINFPRILHKQVSHAGKKVLKGFRWLLLKNLEHLNDTKMEQHRLQEALCLNRSLVTAYCLEEDLR